MPDIMLTQYKIRAYIGVSKVGDVYTYARLGEGFDNVEEALNETVQQYFYLNGAGFAKNHVTGMAPAWTLTGIRVKGDDAQDYIFSKKYLLDTNRQTGFKIETEDENGATVTMTAEVTLCNLTEYSGASTDDAAISVEIRVDGAPTVVNGAYASGLTVVSIAGGTSGKTRVYVNPAPAAGNTYEYKTASTVVMPLVGVDPGATWTAWNGTDDITATTGNVIAIVEVTSGGLAVKAGIATVTSKT